MKEPTKAWEKLTSLPVTPPADMNDPASMKKGTAMKENESMPEYIIWETMTRGMFMKKCRTVAAARHRAKATGTPRAVRPRKTKRSTYSMAIPPAWREIWKCS